MHLNMSAKTRPFITGVTVHKIHEHIMYIETTNWDCKLWNNGIISCGQPMFVSYSTTGNPQNAIFDVMILPILPIIRYSYIYDLFILFDDIFIYLIQYIL